MLKEIFAAVTNGKTPHLPEIYLTAWALLSNQAVPDAQKKEVAADIIELKELDKLKWMPLDYLLLANLKRRFPDYFAGVGEIDALERAAFEALSAVAGCGHTRRDPFDKIKKYQHFLTTEQAQRVAQIKGQEGLITEAQPQPV